MTQTADPFAAVQVPNAVPAQAPAADPFTAASDMADPFATSSDYKGGDYTPSPSIELLTGRLVVMIPRAFDPAAADPNNPGKTRELYTVDLTVLDGGRLEYQYKVKGDPEKGTVDEWKVWTVEDISATSPFTITRFWVPQGGIIGKLKKAHADGRPFLGVPAMVPTKDQRDKGMTAAQVQAEYASWVQRGKAGNRPRYGWSLEDPTPAQRAVAIKWWGAVKDTLAPITPASN